MKILKVDKCKGDNKQSFSTWIAEFEAHTRALDINKNKWRDILLCCTKSTAFTFVAKKIGEDHTIT